MQKDINHIINHCLNTIKDSFLKGTLIQDLTEIKTIANKSYSGNSFQLSITYEVLQKYYQQNKDPVLLSIIEELKLEITKNYTLSGFNYFKERAIPDDLDTASSVVSILEMPDIKSEFNRVIQLNKSQELVKTWFVELENYNKAYFNNTRIYQRQDFFHIDVLLNYLLVAKKTFGEKIDDKLTGYVKEFGLYNYWYIPSLYSCYLYSKLCITTHDDNILKMLDSFVRNYIANNDLSSYALNHKCPFESIKDIVTLENNNDNWLNNGFLIGILRNYSIRTGYEISKHIEPVVKSIISTLNIFEPSLYWSIGLTTYKSPVLSRAFLLQCRYC